MTSIGRSWTHRSSWAFTATTIVDTLMTSAPTLVRLDQLVTEVPGHLELIEQLRDQYRHRAQHFSHDHAGGGAEPDLEEIEHEAIRREVRTAERVAVAELRSRGVIGEEAVRRVERDLDLDELRRAG